MARHFKCMRSMSATLEISFTFHTSDIWTGRSCSRTRLNVPWPRSAARYGPWPSWSQPRRNLNGRVQVSRSVAQHDGLGGTPHHLCPMAFTVELYRGQRPVTGVCPSTARGTGSSEVDGIWGFLSGKAFRLLSSSPAEPMQ